MAKKPAEKRTCFVVGPIGDDDSEDRVHADWLLEDIITPVFEEHFKDFDVTRADKISNPGQITSQVITALLEAELVIADLTTLNPNAFYEIGIRHTMQLPIIHMHLEGQRIPFDIAPFRSIKFSRRRPSDIRAARSALFAAVEEATKEDHEIDNPVTFSRGKINFDQTATKNEKIISDQLAVVLRRLDALEGDEDYNDSPRHNIRVRQRPPRYAMEVRAPSQHELNMFLRNRLDEGFSGLRQIEDNGTNQVIEVPDIPSNREAMERLAEEAKWQPFDVQISVKSMK